MKFRHNHNTYDTEQLGVEAVEDIARQAAFARDVGRQTLEVLGFDPEQEFEPRESHASITPEVTPNPPLKPKELSFRLEH